MAEETKKVDALEIEPKEEEKPEEVRTLNKAEVRKPASYPLGGRGEGTSEKEPPSLCPFA